MYQFTVDEETTKKAKQATGQAKTIFQEFDDVDNKYKTTQKETELNLQKLEYEAPTQEEIKTQAEDSLKAYKTNEVYDINNEFAKQEEKINQGINDLNITKQEKENNIVINSENSKNAATNDAIKNGIARSSIMVNTVNKIEENKQNDLANLAKQTNEQLNILNTKKDSLILEKQNALNAFNIEYAVTLQAKIDSLTQDIKKKEQEVLKYNNQIDEKIAKWERNQEKDRLKNITDQTKYFAEYGTYFLDVLKANEKYDIARKYFMGMDKQSALNELNNNSAYLDNLGKNNYKKLLEEMETRP